ncbi:hypothetical protein NQ318_018179 [Aromia moschata]|uniref:Uncharacterized protein n=1 Tax=Aromia moschata TaxID=1265417 RepID=A0AAV8ZCP4_9CUCU|nr:hypothetical protein NQ318_018179 [Aromia moschata]
MSQYLRRRQRVRSASPTFENSHGNWFTHFYVSDVVHVVTSTYKSGWETGYRLLNGAENLALTLNFDTNKLGPRCIHGHLKELSYVPVEECT